MIIEVKCYLCVSLCAHVFLWVILTGNLYHTILSDSIECEFWWSLSTLWTGKSQRWIALRLWALISWASSLALTCWWRTLPGMLTPRLFGSGLHSLSMDSGSGSHLDACWVLHHDKQHEAPEHVLVICVWALLVCLAYGGSSVNAWTHLVFKLLLI